MMLGLSSGWCRFLEAGVIEVLASITSQHQLNNHFKAHMSLTDGLQRVQESRMEWICHSSRLHLALEGSIQTIAPVFFIVPAFADQTGKRV